MDRDYYQLIVSNSTNITIDPVVISLIKNWEMTIKIKAGQQAGDVYVDDEIRINDITKLYQFVKGKINSLEW